MSLRTRLILAFFTLSVLPLAAVTYYSYTSNVKALRDAAEREADLLAGELGQRMQLVTAQLSERVEHLMDIAELQSAAEEAAAKAAEATAPAAVATEPAVTAPAPAAVTASGARPNPAVTLVGPIAASQSALTDSIAKSLGEAAMLLNNVELQNMRSFGRGAREGGRAGGAGANANASGATAAGDRVRAGRDGRRGGPPPDPAIPPPPRPPATAATPQISPAPKTGAAPAQPPAPTGAPGTPPAVWTTIDPSGKLKIDMAPIRREMFRQILPDRKFENLTAEERQRIAAEVNQRMLGIEQGIKLSAAQLQRQAQQAEKAAEMSAAAQQSAAATQSRAPQTTIPKPAARNGSGSAGAAVPTGAMARHATLSGSRINVKVERNGQVVRQMNAEINLPNVLATVFQTTRSDRGELPFAVSKEGAVYAKSEADKIRVASLGDVAKHGGPATARLNDWIVVTTEDKSGSGLRLGIARPVSDSLATLRRTAARNAGLGLLFIGVALVGIVPLSAGLTRNLSSLSDAVARIAKGDYRARVPVRGNDEVGRLAVAFNNMAADVERHQRTAVEQERIRRELELGRQIQNEMLPHAPLQLGLTQVQGVSVPAREVGGDFFNYFVLDNGDIALLMGDVSGKGVGAALLMANIQAALKARLGLGQDLSAVADALDRDIDANSPGPVYATLFLGILEPATRRLRYVNAGHNPQFVLGHGGLQKMPATGLPVGLLSGRGYSERTVQLAIGDLLFLYTDGCVEAENERGEMFGMDRLEQLLKASAGAADPLKHVEQGIAGFRGKSEPSDDATLMTVKVG